MTQTEERRFTKNVEIVAKDDDERTATGAVLVPDEVDRQRDFLRADAVERLFNSAADEGVMHSVFPDGHAETSHRLLDDAETIGGKEYPAGTWIATRQYQDDDLWQLVKDGVLGGYSIGGTVTEQREYAAGETPDDVTFPAEVERGAGAAEIINGNVGEVSDVDIPAVPNADYATVKSLGKAITDEVDGREEFVEIMRGRGHEPEDARRLWRYLETNKAADVSKPIVLPNGAEFDDFDACVSSVSGDGTSVEEAEAICGSGRERAVEDDEPYDEVKTMTEKAEYSTDEWVSWGASGGRARGQIVDVTEDGTYDDEISGDVTVEGTEDEPAYLIEVWQGTGGDASPIEEEAGRGDTMHVAHLESTLRRVDDPREVEASKSGIIASLKSLFGGSDDGGNTSEAPEGDVDKAGRTLSQRNRRAVMAAVDAQLDILTDAGVDHDMTRFTDRADFAFDIEEYGKGGHTGDEMDKDAPEGDTSDDDMTDDDTTKSDAPEWAESLTEKVEQIDKRVSEMEDGDEDAEKSLDDAPEWAKSLAETVESLDERVDKVSKATADTQQVGGTEKTGDGDSELSETEKQKRELFGLPTGGD